MKPTNYVVITPARNEGEHLPKTIAAITAQTVRPSKWILVNDGSTDQTKDLIEAASKEHSWIVGVHRADRGFRKAGGGVIETFYDGYTRAAEVPWEFLVKLDGDLSFEPTFFERCFYRFEVDAKLGLGGGTICNDLTGKLEPEAKGDPPFHVRGATKIYRRACWDAIGGLLKAPGWDTLDEIKANMLGWRTYTFPELKMHHYRVAGGADGAWKNWVKNGRANYITGYHPLFMMVKCVQRFCRPPYAVAGLGLFTGFWGGYLRRTQQIDDPQLIRYLRRQQMNRLFGKENIWTAPVPALPAGAALPRPTVAAH